MGIERNQLFDPAQLVGKAEHNADRLLYQGSGPAQVTGGLAVARIYDS